MCKYAVRRESGIFHFRLTVPADLRELVGKAVIKFSLGTADAREAERQSKAYAAQYWKQWKKLRAGEGQELDQDALERNVRAFLDRRLKEDERNSTPIRKDPTDPLQKQLSAIHNHNGPLAPALPDNLTTRRPVRLIEAQNLAVLVVHPDHLLLPGMMVTGSIPHHALAFPHAG